MSFLDLGNNVEHSTQNQLKIKLELFLQYQNI